MTISQPAKERNINNSQNIETSFRVQGIPEDQNKICDQILVQTHERVTLILKTVGVENEVVKHRRLGKFQKELPKPCAVLVTLPSATAVNLVMAKCVERQPELNDMNVFVSQALSIEGSREKNLFQKA